MSPQFRIVSYNIRLALDSSLSTIAAVISSLKPDVVCLQEVGHNWVMGEPVDMRQRISDATEMGYGLFAPAIHRGAAQYGIALLSRLPLRNLNQYPLPQRKDEPRTLLAVELDVQGRACLLMTTHLSVVAGDRPAQCGEVEKIASYHARAKRPTRNLGEATAGLAPSVSEATQNDAIPLVLVGDLNAQLDDPELRQLCQSLGLRSALAEALGDSPPTYPSRAPKQAIDHILVSAELEVVVAAAPAIRGSDHIPIWADLKLRRDPL